MDINLDTINHKMDDIRSAFATYIDNGNYAEAEKIINDILMELDANSGIGINSAVDAPDHNFHEVYKLLESEIKNRESSLSGDAAFEGLKNVFIAATKELFQTELIRRELIIKDPNMDEYRQALEAGREDAEKKNEELQKEKRKYDFIIEQLFFDSSVSPKVDRRTIIELENTYITQLEEIEKSLKRIEDWVAEINSHPTDTVLAARNNSNIASVQSLLKQKINNLVSMGLDISTFGANIDDFLDSSNTTSSRSKAAALRAQRETELLTHYAEIKKKLNDAKNNMIIYTDVDGSTTSIANEEVIRTAPDIDLSTPTGPSEMKSLIDAISDVANRLENQIDVNTEKGRIFKENLEILRIEQDLIARYENGDFDSRKTYIDEFDADTTRRIDEEKVLRHKDAEMKFHGSREGAREYKERWKRFKSHLQKNGGSDTIQIPGAPPINIAYQYDILDSSYTGAEKQKDLEFMQIESWEDRNKRRAAIKAILEESENGHITREVALETIAKVYGNARYEQIQEKIRRIQNVTYSGSHSNADLADAKRALEEEQKRLLMQYARDEDYVENYNSAHFDVKDTVALALTGGSAMRSRTNQSKKNLTFKDAVGAFLRWTPYDKKADGKRHMLRTTIANIGGIVSIPFRTLEVAIGASIAGVTALVGKATGTYDMPTPYNVGYFHRKEARREYYLRNGSTGVGAWFKSFFNLSVRDKNGAKVKVNDQIIRERCELIDMSIEDKYIRGARQKILEQVDKAKRNQEARKIAFKNKAKSAELYEDLYINDPEYINASDSEKKKVAERIIQRAILEMDPTFAGAVESYVTGGKKRDGKFYAIDSEDPHDAIQTDIDGKMDFSETIGETIYTNPVSRENIQKGNTKAMDFALRIMAATTLPFFKGILSKWTIKTKHRQPDQIIPEQRTPDTVIPGRHVDGHVEYIHGERQVIQHRPKIGDIQHDVTVTKNVPVSYENGTFADLSRGDTAHWCAALDKYKGPHPSGRFSANATEIQGFNVSFADPLNGQHIEWSTSIPQIKEYINQHPGLHEATTTYQDLSNLSSMKLTQLQDFMPDDIGAAFTRYMNASGNKTQAFNDATQFCWGIPSNGAPIMSQGWSDSNIMTDVFRTITETKTITTRGIVGWEDVVAKVPYTWRKVIEGYDIPAQVIPGKVIPAQVIPGKVITRDIDQAVTIGAMSGVGEVLSGLLGPRYRRGQKGTKNYHDTLDDGSLSVSDRIGDSDMYDTPYDENGRVKKYQHNLSQKDRALHSIDKDGKPMGDVRVFDEDDFVL